MLLILQWLCGVCGLKCVIFMAPHVNGKCHCGCRARLAHLCQNTMTIAACSDAFSMHLFRTRKKDELGRWNAHFQKPLQLKGICLQRRVAAVTLYNLEYEEKNRRVQQLEAQVRVLQGQKKKLEERLALLETTLTAWSRKRSSL